MSGKRESEPRDIDPSPVDLSENGRKVYGLRQTDQGTQLVVVEIGFTIAGLEHELFEAFEARMLRFACMLQRLDYPVVNLTFQRRKAQNKRHWAEFTCLTPAASLPQPDESDA